MRLVPGINQLLKAAVDRKWPEDDAKARWYRRLQDVRTTKLLRVSEAQNHRCCYCQRRTWSQACGESGPIGMMATLEHVVCRSHGGTDNWFNLIMACHACNVKRQDLHTAEEYWEITQGMRPRPKRVYKVRHKSYSEEQREKKAVRFQIGILKLAWLFHQLGMGPWLDSWLKHFEENWLTRHVPVLKSKES